MVGISGAEVFNTVGNTSFGYHSYPIVYFKDDEISTGVGWYIFETTIDYVPSSPIRLCGSKYWCEGGLQNWAYYGRIVNDYFRDFNGISMPASTGDPRKLKIDNGNEKRKQIIRYWRERDG
jgi:hypothetical protein